MKWIAALLTLAVVTTPVEAKCQETASAAENTPLEIARLFAPRDQIIAKSTENFDKGFAASTRGDANLAAVEKQFPGVLAVAGEAGKKVLINAMDASLGDLQRGTAALFTSSFTPAEHTDLLAFMRSPVGRKLVAMGDQIYDADKVVKQMGPDPSATKLTGQDLANSVDYGFIAKLSPEDVRQMAAFGGTSAGRKFRDVTPKMQQLVADWVNRLMAAQQKPMQEAVITAMQAHIAQRVKQ